MKKRFLFIALSALLTRLGLSLIPGFAIDMSVWYAWADRLVKLGFGRFYDPTIWSHYPPGYLYVLFTLGKIRDIFNLTPALTFQLFKLPGNLADMATAWLIYRLIRNQNRKWAILAAGLYLFNPALIFNSSVWGQADSFLTLLLLLGFYFILEKQQLFWSALFMALALLVKPQALFALPVFGLILIKKYSFKKIIFFTFYFLLFTFIFAWPFFPHHPIIGLPALIWQMGQDYPYTTLNAFNFWQLLGNWQKDALPFLGLNYQLWGFVFGLVFETVILIRLFQTKKKENFYLAASLSLFTFFLFLTRMHERYLLPALVFLLLGGALARSVIWLIFYLLASGLHFLNLYHVYSLYQQGGLFNPFSSPMVWFLSLLTVFLFFLLFIFFLKPALLVKADKFFSRLKKNLNLSFNTHGRRYQMIDPRVKNSRIYLILILIFAFLTRIILLWQPKAYIFDEVYHAFTSQEMIKGNIAAWEWWNSPPSGFAYEWTHPHLGKMFMAGSLWFGQRLGLGSDYFWWRLPAAIFGVGVIFLTYLLSKKLFFSEKAALLAAFLLACDGLTLVMSRVGMIDIYFLFFTLLTFLLALQKKWLWTALVWGLALSTKWTGIYLFFPLFLLFSWQHLKKPWVLPRWFLLVGLVLLIYLASYVFFFTSGHNFGQFVELQQQMWGYHTNLKATHSYQSPVLSWPLDLRPVWFYVNYQDKATGNIYALGNPFFFWLGLIVLPLFVYEAILRRSKSMLFCLFLYLIFWLPWIVSPRIMFLYHYLPSLPFLAMILGWMVAYLGRVFRSRWLVAGCCLLIAGGFVFFYPLWTGIPVPKNLLPWFFWLASWK